MGTRHLIAVYLDGVHKVAQYGQWDGYPGGAGSDVLNFLRGITSDPSLEEQFKDNVRSCTWIEEAELKELWDSQTSNDFRINFPEFSRDTGSKILSLIRENPNLRLRDQLSFAAEGLMCEWAYVIDLDNRTFDVYKGFHKSDPPAGERFSAMPRAVRHDGSPHEYSPVHLARSWGLWELPTNAEFLEPFRGHDEDEY